MAQASNIKRALFALGFVGLVGVLTTSEASAFHFGGGGGGGHMSVPHFGGGGFGGGHQSFAHVGGVARGGSFGGGHARSFGGSHYAYNHVSRSHGSSYGGSRGRFTDRRQPHGDHSHFAGHHLPQHDRWAHNHGSRWAEGGSHCGRWHNHGCGGFYAGGPSYDPVDDTPNYDGGGAPVPVYTAPPVQAPVSVPVPVAAPVSTPTVSAPAKTCEAGGTFITVVFQPTATTTSITAFLKEYDVTMADGPSADGMYRIKISGETGAPGQFDQMIGSMRSKKDVVVSIES